MFTRRAFLYNTLFYRPLLVGSIRGDNRVAIVVMPKKCYIENMPKHLIPVLSLTAVAVLLAMLNFTTPTGVGPLGVLVFFVAIYLLMFGIANLLVGIFMKLLGRNKGRRRYLYSAILAFGPIMLLLAQSLGSISPLTVGLTLVFVILGCFLVAKRAKKS